MLRREGQIRRIEKLGEAYMKVNPILILITIPTQIPLLSFQIRKIPNPYQIQFALHNLVFKTINQQKGLLSSKIN
jgi:hypothetical protein